LASATQLSTFFRGRVAAFAVVCRRHAAADTPVEAAGDAVTPASTVECGLAIRLRAFDVASRHDR